MVLYDEHRAVAARMQALLDELDRLKLDTVAVHVDLALNLLTNIIASRSNPSPDITNN